jgi:hypothetical protein
MKWVSLVEVIAVNAVLIPLLALITENYILRAAYWGTESPPFASTTVRYPFFFITSAARGSTRIPGLLSVDWQQIVLVILIVVDLVYLLSIFRAPKSSTVPEG